MSRRRRPAARRRERTLLADASRHAEALSSAVSLLDQALAWWRDDAYVEFPEAPFAVIERLRSAGWGGRAPLTVFVVAGSVQLLTLLMSLRSLTQLGLADGALSGATQTEVS